MSTQSLASRLSLPAFLQRALTTEGFRTLSDFDQITSEELAQDLDIAHDVAEDILRQVEACKAGPSSQIPLRKPPHTWSSGSTAVDELFRPLVHTTSSAPSSAISPGLRPGDSGISGDQHFGLRPGDIAEIAGPPGSGKTSLLVTTVINARLDDLDSHVLVVDTEGGITPSRLKEASMQCTTPHTPHELLHGVHLVRATTQTQFLAFWHTLDIWLTRHPETRLVVVDTLSFHFRQPGNDLAHKRRSMELIRQTVAKASTKHSCAILIADQMATKLLTAENKPANFDTGDRAVLMPQLGDAWQPPRTAKLVIFKAGRGYGERYAYVARRPGETEDRPWAAFDIDDHGLLCDRILE